MRKILLGVVAIMLLTISAYGADFWDSKEFLTYTIENNSGAVAIFKVPTTSIYTTDRILGFTLSKYTNNNLNAEVWCEIYDADSTDIQITDEVLAEAESDTAYTSLDRWFPYPRNLAQGIVVRQGPYSQTIIYFER